MKDIHNLINIGPTNPNQILNQHEIFWIFCMCPSNDTFAKNKKILTYVLGLNNKDSKSTRDKANISNPKVNRGCAPLTANRPSADCVQISLGPSIPCIPLGVYHTGRFNAMKSSFLCLPRHQKFTEYVALTIGKYKESMGLQLPVYRYDVWKFLVEKMYGIYDIWRYI